MEKREFTIPKEDLELLEIELDKWGVDLTSKVLKLPCSGTQVYAQGRWVGCSIRSMLEAYSKAVGKSFTVESENYN